MRKIPALLVLTLMAGCVAPSVPRPISQAPDRRSPAPVIAAPIPADWREWALTPGDWSYVASGPRRSAMFSYGDRIAVTLSCSPGDRMLELSVLSARAGAMIIHTSSVQRSVTAIRHPDAEDTSSSGAVAAFATTDALLDAIAFSRGRWTIEQAGGHPLVLPAYAEVARVVQDCRG